MPNNINKFKPKIMQILSFILHMCFLLQRPMTLGARVLISCEGNHLILVKHTYGSFWYLPGGGVNVGECCEEAAKREVNEEIGLSIDKNLNFLAIKHNKAVSRRDHVVFFHVDLPAKTLLKAQRFEIEEVSKFTLATLPEKVDPLSLSVIREFYKN